MRAAVLGADATIDITTVPDPAPGPGDTVVRVTGCGICGSGLEVRPALPPGTVMGHELAGAMGATALVDPTTEALGGPYDVVVECVGKPGLLDAATAAARTHGRVVVAGVCAEPDPFVPPTALLKELTVRFSVHYRPDELRAVVDASAGGRIDPAPLLTRTVGPAGLDDAFAALTTSPADAKILVDPRR